MRVRLFAKEKAPLWTRVGLLVMILLTLTQCLPTVRLAGYSVLVGIAFFFMVEAVGKTPAAKSGLRFKTIPADLKKPGVLPLVLLPIATALVPLFLGDLIFRGGYSAHVIGRTSSMLSFANIPLLAVQVVVFALGEEIAWRGFFLGKSMQNYPYWLCALVSSALFGMGHIADGAILLVLYDVGLIVVDALIYALIYKKTGNCAISTIAHIVANATGMIACFVLR